MIDQSFYSSADLRKGVIVNAVWQFIAQFSRRYAQEYFFTFEQVHPGSSLAGLLKLTIHDNGDRPEECKPKGVLEFHLGGPNCGSLLVGTPSKPVSFSADVGKNRFVEALLSARYKQFYEDIALELGLSRWEATLPKANRFAIAMQFLSSVQNALAIYPYEFRPICGCCQHSVSYTGKKADFHRSWAYAYFNEKLMPSVDFVGRTDEEISSLFSIQPFDDFQGNDADFVLHTSEAKIRLKEGEAFGEPVDVASLYRMDRKKFVELASSIALAIVQSASLKKL